ncbi:MAG: PAS domain S-box protein [bacterium]
MNYFKQIISLFVRQKFIEEEENRIAKILHFISISILISIIILIFERLVANINELLTPFYFLAIIITFVLVFVRIKNLTAASILLLTSLLGLVFFQAFYYNGIHDTAIFAIPGIFVLAGMLIGKKGYYFITIFTLFGMIVLGWFSISNGMVNPYENKENVTDFIDKILIILLSAIMIRILSNSLLNSLKRTKKSEKEACLRAEQLQISEGRFRALFEGSIDPILLMDENIFFIDCNEAALKILKLDGKIDVFNKTPISISPEFQRDGKSSIEKSEMMLSVAKHSGNVLFEWDHINSEGKVFVVEVSMTLLNINSQNLFLIHWRDITERKKFETEIREKQFFIERITEQSPDIIYVYDVKIKQNIYTNKDIAKYLGYNNSNIPFFNTKFSEQIIHPDDIKQFANYNENVLTWTSEYVFEFEYRMKAKNGEWRWFIGKEKEFQKENGKIITIIGTLREITENKKAEQELIKEKRFTESIINSVPGIFYVYDFNGNIKRWNKNHEIFTGFTAKEISKRTIVDWFDEEERPKILRAANEAFITGKNYTEANLVYKNGNKQPYYFSGVKMEVEGEFYIVGYGIDVSERIEAEKALKFSEEKFSKAFNSSPVSMNITRLSDGIIIDANKTFEEMTGYTRQEIINKKAIDLGVWVDENDKTIMANLLLDKGKIKEKIFQFKDKNNKIHISRYSADTMEINGELCVLALVVDITEQYKVSTALKESESKYSTIFQTSPNIFIVSSLENNKIIEINNSALKAIGLSRNEIIGKTYDDLNLIEKEKRDYLLSLLKMFGSFAGIELKIVLKENIKKTGLFYGQQIEIDNNKYLFLTIVDITDLKRIELALKKSEELYRTLMENMNEAVIRVDNEDKILYVNNKFLTVLGYSAQEILGKISYKILLDPDEYYIIQESNINRQKNIYEQYEIKFKHKDGHKLDFIVSSSPICEVNGLVIGSIEVMTDITERKKAEALLKSSEEKFRLIAENATDVISVQSMDGKFKYVSPSSTFVLGYDPSELIGKSPQDYLHTEDLEKYFNSYNQILIHQAAYNGIFRFKKKDGIYIWIEYTSTIIRDIYNIPKEVQASWRDVTSRILMEQKIEDAKLFTEYVINSIPLALISTDNLLNVTLSNISAQKYLNTKITSTKNIFALSPLFGQLEKVLNKSITKKEIVEEVISQNDENGELKHIKFVISPIDRLNEQGCVILIDDITNARNMEQLMIQSEKMLSVAGLAAGMAHEINNPLGTIVQGCQNILRRVSNELPKNVEVAQKIGINIEKFDEYLKQRQIYEIIDSMRTASSKAAEIIKNMLQFSRRSESKRVLYSIEKLIDQTNELANNDYDFKKKYDFRSIRIIKQYEQNLPEIKITVTEMEQVVFNLIRNAVQALRDENDSNKIPTIILRTFKEDKFIKIEIEDNGPGITEKNKKRIFEPFFTTKEIGEGTGLGLSVSYMIITTNHNGIIDVETKLGSGTKFIIKLPI